MVEVKDIEDIVRSVTYFDSDKASGLGIGQYLLALFIGIMGGMVPQLMRPEFLTQAARPRSLHALLIMVILTHTLSSNAFPTIWKQLVAVVVVYLWFVMLIKTDVRYISAVLLLLVVALFMYRFRTAGSAAARISPQTIAMYKKIEMYIYLATLILSVVAVFMSMPRGRGVADLPIWLFGDIIHGKLNTWQPGVVTATTGSSFGFSSSDPS
jgi:hypothetical protein